MFNYKYAKIIYDLDFKSFDIVPLPLEFKKICKALVGTPIVFQSTQNGQDMKKIEKYEV